MCRTAGAMIPTFDLIEFVHDLDLPVQLRVHPLYFDLVASAADVVCWTDDLVTVDKEMAHGDVHNLVIVLCVPGLHLRSAPQGTLHGDVIPWHPFGQSCHGIVW
jgi:Terpene synthase family 2, C-terminal metal binding